MKRLLLGAVSAIVLTATPALAQTYDEDSGWYLRGNAGYGTHLDADFDEPGLFTGDTDSEGNVAASAGVGYEFGDDSPLDNWRLELDGDTLWTDLGAIGNQPSSFAKLRTNSLMLNAIYAFNDAYSGKITPYIGAGAGIINGDLSASAHAFNNNGVLANNPACLGSFLGTCEVNESDTTLGWQALAGFDMEVAKNLFWDTHYTFRKAGNNDLDFNGTFAPIAGSPAALNHAVELSNVGSHSNS